MRADYVLFDVLYVTRSLTERAGQPVAAEVHLYTYLACLLSLFRGQPAANWGYTFASTEDAAPFSHEVATGLDTLRERGFIELEGGSYKPSTLGLRHLEVLSGLTSSKERLVTLEAACNTSIFVPPGAVRGGLTMDVSTSFAVGRVRSLITESSTSRLHKWFMLIKLQLPTSSTGLLRPALVWLSMAAEALRLGSKVLDDGVLAQVGDE